MQFKVFVFSALATLAAATPTRRTTTPQCCTTVTTASDPEAKKAASLININISDITVPIGLNCVPITVIGGGAAGCNSNPVDCESTFAGGLLSIGCLPINFRRNDTPPPPPPSAPSDQCCESVTTAGDDNAKKLIGLLNINVSDVNVPVGLNCVPITVVGGGAAGCNSNPVTCESADKSWLGLIAIGCVPINLGRRTDKPPTTPPSTTVPTPQCCESTTTAGDENAGKILGLLNVNVSDVNVPVGLNCVPITVVGGGAAGCNDNPVTCETSWFGLISIGCVPINFRRTETPPPPPTTPTPSDQCCQTVTTAGDDNAQKILGLLNINVSDINVPVGLNCVPITVIGGGAAGCNSNPVTCSATDKSWLGLIAIGCLPINF